MNKHAHEDDWQACCVSPGSKVDLADYLTVAQGDRSHKATAKRLLAEAIESLVQLQYTLWASASRAVLVILQGLDAAGKDGVIRHVTAGINPQGCTVHSFRAPTSEEVKHHFLRRPVPCLPAKGYISIFNRSYYEEVLVVRVHPMFLTPQHLLDTRDLWQTRYEEINHFEQALVRNGTLVIKFLLHLSRDEQKQRFLDRIDKPEKNWKFNSADVQERQHWDEYQNVYSQMLSHTSTKHAPWYVIPADNKWSARSLVADILLYRIKQMDLQMPVADPQQIDGLDKAKTVLLHDDG